MERTYVSAGKDSASERRVGHDSDAKFAGGVQEIDLWKLNIECEWRVFNLDRRDRVYGMRAPQGRG